jgi:hypothetical protein
MIALLELKYNYVISGQKLPILKGNNVTIAVYIV